MLDKGIIDALIDDRTVLEATLQQLKVKSELYAFAGDNGVLYPLYLAFNPRDQTRSSRFVAIWDEGIRRLRLSGELTKILKSYGLQDWEK